MTPEQEEQVRRLLASVPPEDGLPPEVAARLDAAVADLVAERGPAPVDELEQRRRRRWPRVLVAAASVSLLAYGVGIAVNDLRVSGGDAASTAARDESFAEGGRAEKPATEGALPETTDSLGAEGRRVHASELLTARTVRLHSATLDADVSRLLQRRAVRTPTAEGPGAAGGDAAGFLSGCALPDAGRGDHLAAVRLDGTRATLVVRKAVDGARVAEVYSCDDASRLLATTSVRADR